MAEAPFGESSVSRSSDASPTHFLAVQESANGGSPPPAPKWTRKKANSSWRDFLKPATEALAKGEVASYRAIGAPASPDGGLEPGVFCRVARAPTWGGFEARATRADQGAWRGSHTTPPTPTWAEGTHHTEDVECTSGPDTVATVLAGLILSHHCLPMGWSQQAEPGVQEPHRRPCFQGNRVVIECMPSEIRRLTPTRKSDVVACSLFIAGLKPRCRSTDVLAFENAMLSGPKEVREALGKIRSTSLRGAAALCLAQTSKSVPADPILYLAQWMLAPHRRSPDQCATLESLVEWYLAKDALVSNAEEFRRNLLRLTNPNSRQPKAFRNFAASLERKLSQPPEVICGAINNGAPNLTRKAMSMDVLSRFSPIGGATWR